MKRIKGAVGISKLLRRLPDEAREGMADILDDFGTRRLAQMKADVPVDTGFLKSRLSKRFQRPALRLRVGFIGKRANSTRTISGKRRKGGGDQFVGKQFYGRFVVFGRKAQNVRVTRRAKVLRITGNNRSEANRRKYVYGPGVYTMRVKAMAARPFVFKRTPLREQLKQDLDRYWTNVLTAAAVGVGFDD